MNRTWLVSLVALRCHATLPANTVGLYKHKLFCLIKVLQLLSQLRKEFKVSRDERVLPLLERFHHGHRLVLQLVDESLKGVVKEDGEKPDIPTITRTLASGAESGDVSAVEEGCSSDTDVFDTVTQLDDETGNGVFYTPGPWEVYSLAQHLRVPAKPCFW